MSASVLRVRHWAGDQGWEGGVAGAYTVSPGPLTSGKCPRQRRALERGQQDLEGYRMKFACYSPRVDYGQSSRPGPGPGPGPGPDPLSRSLRFGLLLSGPWAALSLCTDLPSS